MENAPVRWRARSARTDGGASTGPAASEDEQGQRRIRVVKLRVRFADLLVARCHEAVRTRVPLVEPGAVSINHGQLAELRDENQRWRVLGAIRADAAASGIASRRPRPALFLVIPRDNSAVGHPRPTQSRFRAKARPAAVLRYCSNAAARSRSRNATALRIRHGVNAEVCRTSPWLCRRNRADKSSVNPT